MTPSEFLKTIYLGDRACKAIRIESWRAEVAMEVDCISRIRDSSGRWQFDSTEDIADGRLVFTDVESVQFEPSGPLPNDFINELTAKVLDETRGRWLFEASIGSVDESARTTEVIVRIVARDVHLEDPARAGVKLRT
jgi:hypothetical protein